MAFPDVTICNANPLRRSRVCAYRTSLPGGKGVLKKVLDRDCSANITYSDPNAGDRELSQQLRVWMAQRRKEERSTVRRLFRLGHQLADVVTHCRYARPIVRLRYSGRSRSRGTRSRPLQSYRGRAPHVCSCFARRYFSQTFDSRYGNCFCFHCGTNDQKDEEFFQHETAGSPEDGLELILDAQADEYLSTSMEMGFVVMAHGHGFRPVLCNDAVFVEPGYVTYISLRMEKRTALPEPYQFPCRSSWPDRFRSFGLNDTMYTREDCLYLCQQEHTRRMCGCESSDLPTTSNRRGTKAYPICEEKREQCVKEVQAIMGIESVEKLCKCHRSCVNVEYHREVSRAFFPESLMVGLDGKRRALARVVVYFNTVTYLKLTSVPKYDGGRVVSSFGGINGMYLGVSFFALFGMLEIAVRAAWLLWRSPPSGPPAAGQLR
ncbi:acid-sensing ion channel 2-like [Amblyomma americanum]